MRSKLFSRFFRDVLTETSSEYDITRVSFFIIVLTYVGITVSILCFKHDIDLLDWSIGAATIMGLGGTSVGVRSRLEDHLNKKESDNTNDKDKEEV